MNLPLGSRQAYLSASPKISCFPAAAAAAAAADFSWWAWWWVSTFLPDASAAWILNCSNEIWAVKHTSWHTFIFILSHTHTRTDKHTYTHITNSQAHILPHKHTPSHTDTQSYKHTHSTLAHSAIHAKCQLRRALARCLASVWLTAKL